MILSKKPVPMQFKSVEQIAYWTKVVLLQARHGWRRLMRAATKFYYDNKLLLGGTRTSWAKAKAAASALMEGERAKIMAKQQALVMTRDYSVECVVAVLDDVETAIQRLDETTCFADLCEADPLAA